MLRARRRSSFSIEAVERRLLMASIQVLNTNDTGTGSLRAAIATAASGDTVDLAGLSGTITLASVLTIDKDLTISGPGAAHLTIGGNDHATRAFVVQPREHVAIRDVTIDAAGTSTSYTGAITISDNQSDIGNSASLTLDRVVMSDNLSGNRGGAIYANYATLTIRDSTFVDNHIAGTDFAYGAAIASERMQGLTIENTTFADNTAASVADPRDPDSATSTGGAYGGALVTYGENTAIAMSITNSTFVGNTASISGFQYGRGDGAGIAIYSTGAITMDHNTIVGNAIVNPAGNHPGASGVGARQASGISIETASALSFTNNLVAGNTGGTTHDLWLAAALAAGAKYNLIGDGTDSNLTNGVTGNLVGTTLSPIDAKLAALADNGGQVETIATLAGSPAIKAGVATSLLVDARGSTRGTIAPTIGAYEAANAIPTITSSPTVTAIAGQTYAYEIAAHDDDGDPLSFSYVTTDGSWNTLTDHGDGTATLTGVVPSYSLSFPFTVTASDGVTTGSQTWTLAVNRAPAPTPPAVALTNGTLSVRGSDDADNIHVWTRLNGTQVRVSFDGVLTNFDRSRVTGVHVDGGAGADAILVDVDTLGASVYGGKGNDTITGGAGDDTLGGGGGDDVIYGMAGRDVLRGHGGRDQLFGGAGDDRLYGGDGRDTLDGGLGFDRCWGEAGRDTFHAADGSVDRLDGGIDGLVDGDHAFGDAGDLLTNVVAG